MRLFLTTCFFLFAKGQRLSPEEDLKAHKNCGKQNIHRTSLRVINGIRVSWEKAPWVIRTASGGSGSWISTRHILTAAHVATNSSCNGANSKDSIEIIEDNLSGNSRTTVLKIKRHFVPRDYPETDCGHPKIKNGSLYDIAILEVDIPEGWKTGYNYVCLPQERLKNLTTLHVYGYGRFNYNEPNVSLLHTFNSTAYVMDNSTDFMRFYDLEQMACHGDSGGGAVEFVEGKPIIQALVTKGDATCNPKVLDQRYTMVHPYVDGICAITGRCKSPEHRKEVDKNWEAVSKQFMEIYPAE